MVLSQLLEIGFIICISKIRMSYKIVFLYSNICEIVYTKFRRIRLSSNQRTPLQEHYKTPQKASLPRVQEWAVLKLKHFRKTFHW